MQTLPINAFSTIIRAALRKTVCVLCCFSALLAVKGQISITGTACVVSGGTTGYAYTMSGNYSVTDNISWTVTGGIITENGGTSRSGTVSSIGTQIHVVWNTGTSSGTVHLQNNTKGTSANLSTTIITISNTVSPSSQTVGYNSPATITGGGPNSTTCTPTYTYQWQSSTSSSGPFSNISGATSRDYTVPAVTQTMYYQRVLSYNGNNLISSVASVTVSVLTPGSISTTSNTVTYNTAASVSQNPATGGVCGSYTYEWQASIENGNWQVIGSGASYPAGAPNLIGNTLIRRKVSCGNQVVFTNTLAFTVSYTSANAENWSYIRTNEVWVPGINSFAQADQLPAGQKWQSTTYFDGLGRAIELVTMQASPQLFDIVTPMAYDSMGRQAFQYLAYRAGTTDGKFKSTAIADQNTYLVSGSTPFYPNETTPYVQIKYELSSLSRVTQSLPPGVNWAGSNRGVSSQYIANTTSDSVQIWNIAFAAGSLPLSAGSYAAGQLYKSVTMDENNNQVIQYKDKEDRTILKRVQSISNPGTAHVGWLNTYYVYDSLNNLRFVIPPRAVELINTSSNNWVLSSSIAAELCFRYEYDQRNRAVIKKIPGAGEVWMVYDARDRMVMSQDSNLRRSGKWMVTEYDTLNRPWRTGLLTDANNRSYHQNLAYNSTSYPNTSSNYEILTQAYYDDYNWVAGTGSGLESDIDSSFFSNTNYFLTNYGTSPYYPVRMSRSQETRGMLTGSSTKVIGSANTFLYGVSFFDDHSRAIQTRTTNYSGGKDTLSTEYSFNGKVLRTLLKHQKAGNTSQTHVVATKMEYDQGDRLKRLWKNIDNAATDQLIDSLQYDELGQLKAKYLGNMVDSLVYDYNIRGWMTGINKNYVSGSAGHYFGMELGYDKATAAAAGTTYANPQFNGNIAGTIWKGGGDGINRKYDFTYDYVNRLTGAAFTQNTTAANWDSTTINYTVSNLSYDANGNIMSMNQMGLKGLSSTLIDQLTYSYATNSNKLSQVQDGKNDSLSILGDFHYKGAKQFSDYGYDGNGSMTHDNNKGIDTIIYNYLNLPQQVHMNGKGNILYTYDAGGNKLTKVVMDSLSRHATTTLYLDGFVYQQQDTISNPSGGTDTLQFLLHEEGRTRWAFHRWTNGTTSYKWEYDFFEKDHLGNARELLTQQRDTAQYLATMEAAYRTTENALFYNIPSTCVWSFYVNGATNPFGTSVTNPNDSVCRISGSTPKEGPAIILKVMAGDHFKVGVNGYWKSGQTSTGTTDALTEILSSLANGIIAATGTDKGSYSTLSNTSTSPLLGGVNAFRSGDNPTPPSNPKAYLNYMALDDQFNFDSAASGALLVGGPDTLRTLATDTIRIRKNGYLYIYLTNETKSVSVFFDNLSVTHYPGPLLEETHYYPFGLTMAGISDKVMKSQYAENKYRFNKGSELQNKEFSDFSGLEMYQTHFREIDPQLGRWWQVDPKPSHAESPYSSMLNNPVKLNDPLGDTTWIYGADGHYLGMIPDHLKNQIHYMNTRNKATPINTKGLSMKQITKLAESFRDKSIAFIGDKSTADLQKIYSDPNNKGLESLFVGIVGSDKEIRFSQINVPNSERGVDYINNAEDWVEKQMGSSLNSIFNVGHIHPMEALLEHEKAAGGFTYGGQKTEKGLQIILGDPSYPKDYVNQATLNRAHDAIPPFIIGTPVGLTLYKAGEFPSHEQYYLFKQFKN